MKQRAWIVITIFIVLAAGAGISWHFFGSGTGQTIRQHPKCALDSGGPVARVKIVPIKEGVLRSQAIVYGSVIPAPGALRTVSLPFQSQILSIRVNDGQKVTKGEPLLRIQASPSTYLKLEQARNAYRAQQQNYLQVKRRYQLKLATNTQLLQAKQALEQTKLNLQSLTRRGIDGPRLITATVGGLVKKVYAEEGAIVAAGNPLVEIVAQNRLEVRLGVEPEDIGHIHAGQNVVLSRINTPAAPAVNGKIRKVSYAINPATRLVDVFVTLSSPAGFLLGESVAGKITIASVRGLLVPRPAVLPEGDRHVLFSVKAGRAVRHVVTVGLENDHEYLITGPGLAAGQPVVTLGDPELKNGMRVAVEGN